jgi:hypothetical protein
VAALICQLVVDGGHLQLHPIERDGKSGERISDGGDRGRPYGGSVDEQQRDACRENNEGGCLGQWQHRDRKVPVVAMSSDTRLLRRRALLRRVYGGD